MDKYCQLAQIGYQKFEKVVDILGGKWKLRILYFLGLHRVLRYSELKKLLTPITHKMLSMQLRELEHSGIIIRTEYPQVPPKVEYSISPKGKALMPIFEEMANWIVTYESENQ
ncbi:HTH-type transcriptional activator HxlR [Lachnospiraceae bacterium]|nr:HTH-type transcriptional activator HxlR [Lachnospiraceae bacterium]